MSQFPQHRVSNSDDVRTGNAVSPDRSRLGVPLNGAEGQSVFTLSLGAPAAASATSVAAAQAVAGAGNLTINGSLATSGVATTDVPRNLQIVSSNAGDTTQTATVTGKDQYGQTMSELIAFNGTTPVVGVKAFKTVTQIAISAALAGNASVGTSIKLGLPYRPVVGGFIRGRLNEDTSDAGTYVAPIRTTSTTTTVDVRGTYAPAGALNGTNVYVVAIAVANGPDDIVAYGIAQA